MQFPQLHVGIGRQFGPFTIFPVWSDNRGNLGLTTGTHAQLQVTELASGPEVNRLTVRNAGMKSALLIEGELLEGGHQHRVAAESLVLGPGEQTDVPAFCVEEGRWGGASTQHARRARRAPLHVRAELAGLGSLAESTGDGFRSLRAADQHRVWQRVGRFSEGVSTTHSLVEAYDAPADPATLSYRRHLETPEPLEGQRGVVVGLGGRALILELFGTSTLFRRHWDQFIDALRFEAGHIAHEVGTPGQSARDFVAGLSVAGQQVHLSSNMKPITDQRGPMRVRHVRTAVGRWAYNGVSVNLHDLPVHQFAHLTVWDTAHPLATV